MSSKTDTRCVKGKGVQSSDHYKTKNPPIHLASTVVFDTYEEWLEAFTPPFHGKLYGTYGGPIQIQLEKELAELEGAARSLVCPAGITAITTTLMGLCRQGDHVLICDNVYDPTREFSTKVFSKYGVETDFVPSNVGAEISNYIKDNTKVIFLESPGSITFEIQDLEPIVKLAKEKDIWTVLDNSWATPLYLRAFDLGIDVSIHSLTKYISGHSDVLLGAINCSQKAYDEIYPVYETMEVFGDPQSCYLALRGLRTLPVRLRQHEKSALTVARWLEDQDEVEQVIHPPLPSHPQHERWKKYFTGASGLFSITLKEKLSREELARRVNRLKLFGIGGSWGGFGSLIKVSESLDRNHPDPRLSKDIFRINVGLEDPADLIEDLKKLLS